MSTFKEYYQKRIEQRAALDMLYDKIAESLMKDPALSPKQLKQRSLAEYVQLYGLEDPPVSIYYTDGVWHE